MDVSGKYYSCLFSQTFIVTDDAAEPNHKSAFQIAPPWQREAAAGDDGEYRGHPESGHPGPLH